jgi:FkbM family methyltransferase
VKIKHRLLSAMRRHAQQRRMLSDVFAKTAQAYLDAWHNLDHDMQANGEVALLDRLAHIQPRVVFDVGANRGDWLDAARARFPEAAFHAFEIAPATFRRLAERFAATPVALNEFGLSDHAGPIELRFYPGNDPISTLLDTSGIHAEDCESVVARVDRGETYCRERGIETIDVLKIDTEGAEPMVLRGFGPMLDQGRVDVIQFEYGMANIYNGALLRDLHEMLGSRGYAVGKLFPRGVEFRPYAPRDEDFRGPNYVAVRENRQDLLDALSV